MQSSAATFALVVARVLALALGLVLFIPVILLPRATATPTFVWLALIVVAVALLTVQFWFKPLWRGVALSLAGLLAVSILAVLASQFFAAAPPITGANDEPLPGSIATLDAGRTEWQPPVGLDPWGRRG